MLASRTSINSLTNTEVGGGHGTEISSHHFKSTDELDRENIEPIKRKLVENRGAMIISEYLSKTRININNIEHARVA